MRVVKIGGRVQADPALASAIAAAWPSAAGTLCLVHGGGDEVSRMQRLLGREPRFVRGRRVTDAADIETLRMTLSGSANKRLTSALVAVGLPAIGLSGEDASLLVARRAPDEPLGLVGSPETVNAGLLRLLLGGGFLPVISPLARGIGGDASTLNVNGDDAAAAIAASLDADELLLIADVPGVLVDGTVVGELAEMEARTLIASGQAAGGMAAKLEAALHALHAGVDRVRIGGLMAIADSATGTVISLERSMV